MFMREVAAARGDGKTILGKDGLLICPRAPRTSRRRICGSGFALLKREAAAG
jgi:hypothetical protein